MCISYRLHRIGVSDPSSWQVSFCVVLCDIWFSMHQVRTGNGYKWRHTDRMWQRVVKPVRGHVSSHIALCYLHPKHSGNAFLESQTQTRVHIWWRMWGLQLGSSDFFFSTCTQTGWLHISFSPCLSPVGHIKWRKFQWQSSCSASSIPMTHKHLPLR